MQHNLRFGGMALPEIKQKKEVLAMRRKDIVCKLAVSVFVILLLLSSGVVYAGSDWEIAYVHDENGQRIRGRLHTLVTAIKRGAGVKVMVFYADVRQTYKAEETIFTIDQSLVVAKCDGYAGLGSSNDYTLVEDRRGPLLLKTDGSVEYITYNAAGTAIINHVTDLYYKMKWFINR